MDLSTPVRKAIAISLGCVLVWTVGSTVVVAVKATSRERRMRRLRREFAANSSGATSAAASSAGPGPAPGLASEVGLSPSTSFALSAGELPAPGSGRGSGGSAAATLCGLAAAQPGSLSPAKSAVAEHLHMQQGYRAAVAGAMGESDTVLPLAPPDESFVRKMLASNYALLGEDHMSHVRSATFVVVGLGTIGSHVAHLLARLGVQNLRLIDFDLISVDCLAWHPLANVSDLGSLKVACMKRHLSTAAPHTKVDIRNAVFDITAADHLLDGANYVIDCIGHLPAKVALILYCTRREIPIVSALSASYKTDGSIVQLADIRDTHSDPCARKLRHELERAGLETPLPVIYSPEVPISAVAGSAASVSLPLSPTINSLSSILSPAAAQSLSGASSARLLQPASSVFSPILSIFGGLLVAHVIKMASPEFRASKNNAFDGDALDYSSGGISKIDTENMPSLSLAMAAQSCHVSRSTTLRFRRCSCASLGDCTSECSGCSTDSHTSKKETVDASLLHDFSPLSDSNDHHERHELADFSDLDALSPMRPSTDARDHSSVSSGETLLLLSPRIGKFSAFADSTLEPLSPEITEESTEENNSFRPRIKLRGQKLNRRFNKMATDSIPPVSFSASASASASYSSSPRGRPKQRFGNFEGSRTTILQQSKVNETNRKANSTGSFEASSYTMVDEQKLKNGNNKSEKQQRKYNLNGEDKEQKKEEEEEAEEEEDNDDDDEETDTRRLSFFSVSGEFPPQVSSEARDASIPDERPRRDRSASQMTVRGRKNSTLSVSSSPLDISNGSSKGKPSSLNSNDRAADSELPKNDAPNKSKKTDLISVSED